MPRNCSRLAYLLFGLHVSVSLELICLKRSLSMIVICVSVVLLTGCHSSSSHSAAGLAGSSSTPSTAGEPTSAAPSSAATRPATGKLRLPRPCPNIAKLSQASGLQLDNPDTAFGACEYYFYNRDGYVRLETWTGDLASLEAQERLRFQQSSGFATQNVGSGVLFQTKENAPVCAIDLARPDGSVWEVEQDQSLDQCSDAIAVAQGMEKDVALD
ncbi:MAG: hypothetical protein ACTHK4_06240 [Mycobacteriales bacterium]